MASAVVFLFVLDTAPVFNKSSENVIFKSQPNNDVFNVTRCNPTIVNPILLEMGKVMKLEIIPPWRHNTSRTFNIKESSPETIYDVGTVFDNSIPDDSVENTQNTFVWSGLDDKSEQQSKVQSKTLKIVQEISPNVSKVVLPETLPYLVAIFETLSNVTAQTCAGAMVSSRWVVTAASCISLLGSLFTEADKTTVESHYTVVVGSSNPLTDGAPYNVTQVLLPPSAANSSQPSSVVLMKIDPPVELKEYAPIAVVADESLYRLDLRVYGWIITQNASGDQTMRLASFPAKASNITQRTSNNSVCLEIDNRWMQNITQMNTGGPVLGLVNDEVRVVLLLKVEDTGVVAHRLPARGHWWRGVVTAP